MRSIKEKNSYFGSGLGVEKVADENIRESGFTYKMSQCLMENIVSKKDTTSLFPITEEDILNVSQADVKITSSYTDKKKKRVYLSPFQQKIVAALARIIDGKKDEETVRYIERLPSTMEDKQPNKDGIYKPMGKALRLTIDIPNLARMIYSKPRVGGKQQDKVKSEIIKLGEIRHQIRYKMSQGTITQTAPLLTWESYTLTSPDGTIEQNKLVVCLDDLFAFELNTRYSLCPITFLKSWNETKVNTELFSMILHLLVYVRGNYVKHSKTNVSKMRAQLQKEKVDKEEIEKRLQKYKRECLTYKESLPSLLERIETKKYVDVKNGKEYVKYATLKKDMIQAKKALLQMGIITDYYQTKNPSGEEVCNFVLNDKWIENERKGISGEN